MHVCIHTYEYLNPKFFQLPKGGVLRVTALGQNFAVFRGLESGKAYVTDAYCPVRFDKQLGIYRVSHNETCDSKEL